MPIYSAQPDLEIPNSTVYDVLFTTNMLGKSCRARSWCCSRGGLMLLIKLLVPRLY